jgi:hypothetical protein
VNYSLTIDPRITHATIEYVEGLNPGSVVLPFIGWLVGTDDGRPRVLAALGHGSEVVTIHDLDSEYRRATGGHVYLTGLTKPGVRG